MRKFLAAVAGLALLPLVVIVATTSPAEAAVCNSNKRYMVENWYKSDVEFVYVETGINPYKTAKVTLSAHLFYEWCPNGSGDDKLKIEGVEFCVRPDSGEHHALDSVRFDASIWSDNVNDYNNPPLFDVATGSANWTGTRWCKLYAIPNEHQRWYLYKDDPRWQVEATLNIDNYDDKEVDFSYDGAKVRHVNYGTSEIVLDWY
jgi:hypothetical protein